MKTKAFTLLGLFAILLWTFPGNSPVRPASASSPVIDQALASRLETLNLGEPVRVIVSLASPAGGQKLRANTTAERRQALVQTLRSQAGAAQQNLRGYLTGLQGRGSVRAFTPLWIVNAIAVTADAQTVRSLAAYPGVEKIALDRVVQGPEPAASTAPVQAEQNVALVNAPALWSLGFAGQGVVIASLDTGVDYTHPDLISSWRGGADSWYDPYGQHSTLPVDLNGHGTRVMGVMVGQGNSGKTIGVAPQAKWIAAKIFDDSNHAQLSAIHQAYQWVLDPDGNPATDDAPNIVNNSWDFNGPGCDLTFEPDLQTLVDAGIIPVFAAGNYGPGGETSASPGNNPSAIAVGDTDNSDQIDPFSSRGTTTCGRAGASLFPALVAPGMTINTTDLAHRYAAVTGTSFSAPSVSGALALLLSAFPQGSSVQPEAALIGSAKDLGFSGPDNTYGNGRIDVLAAYTALATLAASSPTPGSNGTVIPTPMETPTPIEQVRTVPPFLYYFPFLIK